MEKVRIGVIGAGRIAHVMCAAYEDIAQAEIVAVMDVVPESATALADRFGAKRTYSTTEDLLADREVDAVLVCAPTQLHAEIVVKAAAAGKHIFCQKPMALSVADCDLMNEAVAAAGVVMQIGFMLRFTPPFGEAKKRIEQGEIGDLIGITGSLFGWVPSADWFYDPKRGGGVLIDTMSHQFDLFRWYGGDFETVYASGGAYVLDGAREYGTPDNVMASFRFQNGAMGNLYGSWTSGYGDLTVQVFGTEGSIFIDLMDKQGGQIYSTGRGAAPATGWNNLGILWKYGYEGEAKQFVKSVLGQVAPSPTGLDARETMRMLFLADRSIRTGERIIVADEPS